MRLTWLLSLPVAFGSYFFSIHFPSSHLTSPHFATHLMADPTSAQFATIYWPVSYPNAGSPWIVGQKNIVSWSTGGGTGVTSFDIQLHNSNKAVMIGFMAIALRVPMEKFPGSSVFGGEIEVDLNAGTPTGLVELFYALAGHDSVVSL